jgi:hypothetical protein
VHYHCSHNGLYSITGHYKVTLVIKVSKWPKNTHKDFARHLVDLRVPRIQGCITCHYNITLVIKVSKRGKDTYNHFAHHLVDLRVPRI